VVRLFFDDFKNSIIYFLKSYVTIPQHITVWKGGVLMLKIARIFLIGVTLTFLVNAFSFSVQASEVSKIKESRWVKGEGTVLTGSFALKAVKNPAHERGEVYYEEAPATGSDKIKGTIKKITFDRNRFYFWGDGYRWDSLQNEWESGYKLSGFAQDNDELPDQFRVMWCKVICKTFLPTNLNSGFIKIH